MQTTVIVNPKSGKLSGAHSWAAIEPRLREAIGPFDAALTQATGGATALAREALRRGAERVVAVGGDGTLSEVVNGFFDGRAAINPAAVFSFLMCGTGNDFQKTLGRPASLDESLNALRQPREKLIDVGRLTYVGHDGLPREQHFLNIASCGMGGAVDRYVNAIPLRGLWGGKASFLAATLIALLVFRNKRVRLVIDDQPPRETRVRVAVVANGRFAGGGMMFAPHAELDDGLFDIVLLENVSRIQAVRHMPKIYAGRHLDLDQVVYLRGRRVEATSDEEVLLDIDGEAPGRLPATFEIVPQALRIQY